MIIFYHDYCHKKIIRYNNGKLIFTFLGQIHNPTSYVRDYYFFKRSQYPQLELIQMDLIEAFNQLQSQELIHKFIEIGKVLLTWAILKNVDMVSYIFYYLVKITNNDL